MAGKIPKPVIVVEREVQEGRAMSKCPTIFVSYKHTNRTKFFLTGLEEYLRERQCADVIELWRDALEIRSGAVWSAKLESVVKRADAYLVLASAAYFQSEVVRDVEWPVIKQRVKEGDAKLFWIAVDKPVQEFLDEPFLAARQATGSLLGPLDDADKHRRAEFCHEILEEMMDWLGESSAITAGAPGGGGPVLPVEMQYLRALRHQLARLLDAKRYLPIEQLYVRLRADERNVEERDAGRRHSRSDINARLNVAGALEAEVIPEHVRASEREAATFSQLGVVFDDTIEGMFQRHRYLVVRGGPGSGKTVMCCHLANELLGAWGSNASTTAGPGRLPIVVTMRDYAAACRARSVKPALFEYLGHHVAGGDVTLGDAFNAHLLKKLRGGEVAIFLDGLDEVPVEQRYEIIEDIEKCVATIADWMEELGLSEAEGEPATRGGTQVLVTSRKAGYDLAPIRERRVRQFEILPFDAQAVTEFCRNWARVRFGHRVRPECERLTDELLRCIVHDATTAVRELSSTPLLLSVLCNIVAPLEDDDAAPRTLPSSRAEVYEQALVSMMRRWKRVYGKDMEQDEQFARLLEHDVMISVLADVARFMQDKNILRSMTEGDLRKGVQRSIHKLVQSPAYGLHPDVVVRMIEGLIDLFRTHVGVISETSPGLFEFHHLTFQEYLVGRSLCLSSNGAWHKPEVLAEWITEQVSDPQWREPLLLAFAQHGLQTSREGRPEAVAALLEAVRGRLRAAELSVGVESAAQLCAEFVLELPDILLPSCLDQAITDFAQCFAELREEVGSGVLAGIAKLRRRAASCVMEGKVNPFDLAAMSVIRARCELAAPIMRLFVDRGWLSEPVLACCMELSALDDPSWGWPIHEGLLATTRDEDREPEVLEPVAPDADAPGSLHRTHAIIIDQWRDLHRSFLERVRTPRLPAAPEVRAIVDRNMYRIRTLAPRELQALIALCGGYQDLQCSRWQREYSDFAQFLQRANSEREALIELRPLEFHTRWGWDDVIYTMAVYLDQKQGGRNSLSEVPPSFQPAWIVRELPARLREILESCLGGQDVELLLTLHDFATSHEDPDLRARAVACLIACGHGVTPELCQLPRLRWHLERMLVELRDPVVRLCRRRASTRDGIAPLWSVLKSWLPNVGDADAAGVFRHVMGVATHAIGLPVQPPDLGSDIGPILARMHQAEVWASGIFGGSDDDVHRFTTLLDSAQFPEDLDELAVLVDAILSAANAMFLRTPAEYATGSEMSTDARLCEQLLFLCDETERLDPRFGRAFFDVAIGPSVMAGHEVPVKIRELAGLLPGHALEFDGAVPAERTSALSPTDATGAAESDPIPEHMPSSGSAAFEGLLEKAGTADYGWHAFALYARALHYLNANIDLETHVSAWQAVEEAVSTRRQVDIRRCSAKLVDIAGQSDLRLTSEAALAVNRLAACGIEGQRVLEIVVPLLRHPSPEAMPILKAWASAPARPNVTRRTVELLRSQAILMLAERSGRIELASVVMLGDLEEAKDDVVSARASLMLGGPTFEARRDSRRFRLSELGAETVVEIVRDANARWRAQRYTDTIRAIDDLVIDGDLPHGRDWETLTTERDGERPIEALWRRCGEWTQAAMSGLAEWFREDLGRFSESCLIGYAMRLYQDSSAVPEAMHSVARDAVRHHDMTIPILPEDESYGIVAQIIERSTAGADVIRIDDLESALAEVCREGPVIHGQDFPARCLSLAETVLQLSGVQPEYCANTVRPFLQSERWYRTSMAWLDAVMSEWRSSAGRRDVGRKAEQYVLGRKSNALLCFACVLTEYEWVHSFAELTQRSAKDAARWRENLVAIALEHSVEKARAAALTLLARLPGGAGADTNAVIHRALRDNSMVRARTMALLPQLYDLDPDPAMLDDLLQTIRSGEASASHTLTSAKAAASFVRSGRVRSPKARRQVTDAIHEASLSLEGIRPIARLTGSPRRRLLVQGRLDQELRHVLAEL